MAKWQYFILSCLTACLLTMPAVTQATEEPEEITNENTESYSDMGRADDWFTKPKEADGIMNQSSSEEKAQNKKEKERYVFLLEDNGFAYYMDTRNAKWMKIPYSENEDIVDVWIRLVKTEPDEEYSYPQKYFLEHYYIRPKTKQIQFLSELEVTGRPDNTVKERPYSVRNWENLVSGSLEDEIYHRVLKVMKRDPFVQWFKGKSFRDVLEDSLWISI